MVNKEAGMAPTYSSFATQCQVQRKQKKLSMLFKLLQSAITKRKYYNKQDNVENESTKYKLCCVMKEPRMNFGLNYTSPCCNDFLQNKRKNSSFNVSKLKLLNIKQNEKNSLSTSMEYHNKTPSLRLKIQKCEITPIRNAIVSGKKIGARNELNNESLTLSEEVKKSIILIMLKENKIPSEILSKHNESKEDDKISEAILNSYDIIVRVDPRRNYPLPKTSNSSVMNKKILSTINKFSRSKDVASYTTVNNTMPILKNPSKRMTRYENLIIHKRKRQELMKLPKGVKNSSINQAIWTINKYTAMTFRNKTCNYDLKAINILHKRLGLGKAIITEDGIKSRERFNLIKEGLYKYLYTVINKANSFTPENIVTVPKCYISNGNNGQLVKSILRERYWSQSESFSTSVNLLWTQWRNMNYISTLGTLLNPIHENSLRISNHLEDNYYIGYKKNMYKCLSLYYSLINKNISHVVPLTFHVKKGKLDPEYLKFKKVYLEKKEDDSEEKKSSGANNKNIWILKPGENTNRGEGIFVSKSLVAITERITKTMHTHIIQRYIEKPFLFEKRKFDIRCFALVTSINGIIKAYYYHEGYLRTSSKDYSVHNLSKSVHLTNEAIQIKYEGFGKHEAGNKVSYTEFTKYLLNYCKENKIEPPINFKENILPQIKVFVVLSIRIL